jgi:hypothetical protein
VMSSERDEEWTPERRGRPWRWVMEETNNGRSGGGGSADRIRAKEWEVEWSGWWVWLGGDARHAT